jgi:hypothetical protein
VNICAIDIRKAFDTMSLYCLFIKLMDRMIPISVLKILEHWFNICLTCVRWGLCISQFVNLTCGVRQGGVLSPYLFSVYIDDIVHRIAHSDACSKINVVCVSIFMYADDILLISPSVTLLQKLVNLVENELDVLDMAINHLKSVCLRIGPKYDIECTKITLINGDTIAWAKSCNYLGVCMKASFRFKCEFDKAKKSFYRNFNAIYGKIGRCASLDVVFHLIDVKCIPGLMYGLNACPVNKSESRSLDFTVYRIIAKVLGTTSSDIVNECRNAFGLDTIKDNILKSKRKFLTRYINTENKICSIFSMNATAENAMLL